MKKSRYTDSQIMAIFKQNVAGVAVLELCREHGMSSASFYKWRVKLSDENTEIAEWLVQLTTTNKRWGFGLCFFVFTQYQRLRMESQACLSHLS